MDFNMLKTALRIVLSILSAILFSKYRLTSLMFRSMTWFKRQRRGVKVKHTDHEGYRFSYFTRGEPGPRPSMLMLHGFSLNKDIWLNTIKVGFHFLFGKPHRSGKAVQRHLHNTKTGLLGLYRGLPLQKHSKGSRRWLHVSPPPPSYPPKDNSVGNLFTGIPGLDGEEKCLVSDLSCETVTEVTSVTKTLVTDSQVQHQAKFGAQEENEIQVHGDKASHIRNPSQQMANAECMERGNRITSLPDLTEAASRTDLNDVNISAEANLPGAAGVPPISQIISGSTRMAGHNLNRVFGMGLGIGDREIPPLARIGHDLVAAHSHHRDGGPALMVNPGRRTHGEGFLRSRVSFPAHVTGDPAEVMVSAWNKGMTRTITMMGPKGPQPTHRAISASWDPEVVLNDDDDSHPFPPSYRRRFNRETVLATFPDDIPWMGNMESPNLLVPPDNLVAFNTFNHDGSEDHPSSLGLERNHFMVVPVPPGGPFSENGGGRLLPQPMDTEPQDCPRGHNVPHDF